MQTEGVDIRSVGNTAVSQTILLRYYLINRNMSCYMYIILQVLHETALVETFNLKAAIEYQLKNCMLIKLVTLTCDSIFPFCR
jgi:hypothetical protein